MDLIVESIFTRSNMAIKVAIFFMVQALVYLILSKSSSIFSNSDLKRTHSFRPARSVSIRRFLTALADMPTGGEFSPAVPKGSTAAETTPKCGFARRQNYAS